jgi:hypothetical protein
MQTETGRNEVLLSTCHRLTKRPQGMLLSNEVPAWRGIRDAEREKQAIPLSPVLPNSGQLIESEENVLVMLPVVVLH